MHTPTAKPGYDTKVTRCWGYQRARIAHTFFEVEYVNYDAFDRLHTRLALMADRPKDNKQTFELKRADGGGSPLYVQFYDLVMRVGSEIIESDA